MLPIKRCLIYSTCPVSWSWLGFIFDTSFQASLTEVRTLYKRTSTLTLCEDCYGPTTVLVSHFTCDTHGIIYFFLWNSVIFCGWFSFGVNRELKFGGG
jgi:hypothetical protein